MTRHWTEDDFIARLYGLGQPDAHLDECGECREAWKGFQATRESVRLAGQVDVSTETLMGQRREIHRKLGQQRHPAAKRAVPILAAAGMLIIGLVLVRPAAIAPEPQAAQNQSSDAQFFQEVAAIAQSSEPRAAQPIEALFEE